MNVFKPGDVVRLKPSGPCLTVERPLGENRCYCVWFSTSGEQVGNEFDEVLLSPVEVRVAPPSLCDAFVMARRSKHAFFEA